MNSPEKSWIVVSLVTIFLWFALPAGSQTQSPEGKELGETVCGGQCHDLETATSPRRSREKWLEVVSDMVSRGAPLLLDEIDPVTQYLAEHFGPEASSAGPSNASAQNKVNVNKATAKEMEAALGFSTKEASQVIRYREENGSFSKWEELKKVPGLDAKKLDEVKDRLVF